MPKNTPSKPGKNAKKAAPKGAAQKIRQGKAELSDDQLAKVSGGQSARKSFNFS
jgi:bacteriocin-like protein